MHTQCGIDGERYKKFKAVRKIYPCIYQCLFRSNRFQSWSL